MPEVLELLEQIVQDTVNSEVELSVEEEMEEFSQVSPDEFMEHVQNYIDRWLDSYSERHTTISFEALMGLYMSGFITGRIYEERRDAKPKN